MSAQSKSESQKSKIPGRHRPTVDTVTTIASDGSHRVLHPADVHGRYTTARRWSGWALIAFYLVLPWIPVGGHPAVFIDIAEGRFHFFGYTLAAQDTWLLFFGVSVIVQNLAALPQQWLISNERAKAAKAKK